MFENTGREKSGRKGRPSLKAGRAGDAFRIFSAAAPGPASVAFRVPAFLVLAVIFLAAAVSLFLTPHPARAVSAGDADAPVSLDLQWYAPDQDVHPGASTVLVIRVTPPEDAYMYAGPSLAKSGKPTVLRFGVPHTPDTPDTTGGALPLSETVRVFFPPPEHKEDPWSGTLAAVYTGPFRLAVPFGERSPLDGEDPRNEPLVAELAGLVCGEKNCTPFVLPLTIVFPPEGAPLPALADQDWAQDLSLYTAEIPLIFSPGALSPDALAGGGASPGLGRGAVSLGGRLRAHSPAQEAHGEGAIAAGTPLPGAASVHAVSPVSEGDGTSLVPVFTPVYFVPELEVASLGKAVLLGFLAGIVLNFMPCVLPVLGLKLSSLMAGTHGESEEVRKKLFVRHQLAFSAGIMVWFTVLGGVLAAANLVWGQLFQSSGLVLGLTLLLLLLALNLFGVFSLPILDLGAQSGNGSLQAFSSGFTATLLATPCSGPLLGGVLSWALLQPPLSMLISLWSVGVGMAAPYLLMTFKPGLLTRLPRPGPWMRYMEGGLAFLLLGAAAYLASLLPPAILPKALGALVLTALAAWIWGQIGGPSASRATRRTARVSSALLLALAFAWPLGALTPAAHPLDARAPAVHWQEYSPAAFAEKLGQAPLLVQFTADWCPTCKVMEATTLAPANLAAWQKRFGIIPIRVDLTRENEDRERMLRAMGSSSIPLIALFPAGENAASPMVLRDVVTARQVEEAMRAHLQRQ